MKHVFSGAKFATALLCVGGAIVYAGCTTGTTVIDDEETDGWVMMGADNSWSDGDGVGHVSQGIGSCPDFFFGVGPHPGPCANDAVQPPGCPEACANAGCVDVDVQQSCTAKPALNTHRHTFFCICDSPAGPTCNDGIQNQGETGVDCGGPCAACPTCNDGIQNQGETGVDCGGPCAACPTCNDGIQNQGETGVDCGGPCAACPTCNDGIQNQGETGVDCGGPCAACATCNDGIQNQGETGIDCGGPCAACPTCNDGIQNQGETGVDCGGPCAACGGNHLVISEILSRSTGGGNDEYIELYNPTGSPITLDATWKIDARSSTAASYSNRWTGSGQVIPAHGHFLIVGSSYSGAVAGDATLSTGITDATSLVLSQGGVNVDVVCYAFNASSVTALQAAGYVCEGTPLGNNPHDNTTNTNVNQSLERKPGGASGNGTDTDVNTADFLVSVPSNPQNLSSPLTP